MLRRTHRQHARDMHRLAAGAVVDLVPAGGAVGDDQRVGVGLAHRRQQRQLAHRQRHVDGVGGVAEAPAMPQQLELDRLDLRDRARA